MFGQPLAAAVRGAARAASAGRSEDMTKTRLVVRQKHMALRGGLFISWEHWYHCLLHDADQERCAGVSFERWAASTSLWSLTSPESRRETVRGPVAAQAYVSGSYDSAGLTASKVMRRGGLDWIKCPEMCRQQGFGFGIMLCRAAAVVVGKGLKRDAPSPTKFGPLGWFWFGPASTNRQTQTLQPGKTRASTSCSDFLLHLNMP